MVQQGLGTCGGFNIIHGLSWDESKVKLNPLGFVQTQTQLTVHTEVCTAQLGWPAKSNTGFWDLVLSKLWCTDLAHSLPMFQSFISNLVMIILIIVINQLYKMLWRCRQKASTLCLLLSIKNLLLHVMDLHISGERRNLLWVWDESDSVRANGCCNTVDPLKITRF